jgi:hypothetical protein
VKPIKRESREPILSSEKGGILSYEMLGLLRETLVLSIKMLNGNSHLRHEHYGMRYLSVF